jgi:chromosome segregation ATPase
MSAAMRDQLAALDAEIAAAHARVAEIRAEAEHVCTEAARLSEALTEAYAEGATRQANKIAGEKAKAESAAAEPWRERIAGAERAAARKQAERDTWVGHNLHDLLIEMAPDADAAADGITAAVAALEQARMSWHAIESQVGALLAVAPGRNQRVPQIDHVDTAIRDVRRAIDGLPRPLPVSASMPATVVPEHDPDPDVREPARARIAGRRGAA